MSTILSTVRSRSKTILSEIKASTTATSSHDFFITYSRNLNVWPNKANAACNILVLDSSFNPPTLAHRALLTESLASFPKDYFDASIVLFSTRNVDKQLTGASVLQRAQMMEIMARQFGDTTNSINTSTKALENIAVALTPHGRFIDKSIHIQTFFKHQFDANVTIKLYFIMGFDTITRFLDPVYYPEGRDTALEPFFRHSHLICADRPGSGNDNAEVFWSERQKEEEGLGTGTGTEAVSCPYNTKKITRIKLENRVSCLSSTLARNKIKQSYSTKDTTGLEEILDKDIIQFIYYEDLYKGGC
ncbi:hypothetical protein J3Q64DRAFT_1745508 [Phycomyces blakesleeanus]|uniref:Cytidyltransferase-like domain-containing protein n=2 Tax=Phycomyces blakesleeanus TaxID=4837 RepID=A0ABR3AXF2_PHYBL